MMGNESLLKLLKQQTLYWRELYAIAVVETHLNHTLARYEPHYRWLYKPDHFAKQLGITIATEKVFQKCSWGLFQMMGAVLRELGYQLMIPVILKDIKSQIKYADKHFNRLLKHYGSVDFAIAGWNAGFGLKDYNTSYYKKVKKILEGTNDKRN